MKERVMSSKGNIKMNTQQGSEADQRIKDNIKSIKDSSLDRYEILSTRPKRNPVLHWIAVFLSIFSLGLLSYWVVNMPVAVPKEWIYIDLGIGIIFILEFLTRSGFRWNKAIYLRTHIFDFIAIVPALILVNRGYPLEAVWVWLILITRAIRMIDRLLGDGFIQRNLFALVEGFEEEITDRVTLRIINRLEEDVSQTRIGQNIAGILEKNKAAVLKRVKEEHPREGFGAGLAHLVGLDILIERSESRIYDSLVEVIKSPEVEQAIREGVDSTFISIRKEIETKTWRTHLGFKTKQPNL
jgi:hypothetical protein